MNYSNQYQDSISTVQLSPFGEEHWNRIVTYSPIYVHWTDLIMTPAKRPNKPTSGKRHLINRLDINSIKLDDEILLNELHNMRRTAVISRIKRDNSYHEAKFLEEEHGRRTTSPVDEYQRSENFFYPTESSKPQSNYIDLSFTNQEHHTKRSTLQPQPNNIGPLKATGNINFGPKPQPSLGIQLQQSAITRQHALENSIDHRIISPITMSSSRRAIGSAHSARRTNQQNRTLYSQTPQTTETNVIGGLYEQLSTDSSSSSAKKFYPRSTNNSRSTMHMLKTKNERARQKQQIQLKTILVRPCRPPISGDSDLEETIPNSIEVMRRLGGPVTIFERNLRYNYHRQLNQFRNGSNKG